MAASPANLKTRTPSPAERQVVEHVKHPIFNTHPISEYIIQGILVRLDLSFLMATSMEGDSRVGRKWSMSS